MNAPGKVFVAESDVNPSVGTKRYRAFCSCGWDSEWTEHHGVLVQRVDRHRSEHSTLGVSPAIFKAAGA